MTGLRHALARLRAWLGSRRADADFHDELDAHVALLVDDYVRQGRARAEAERLARLRVGSAASLGERHRVARGLPLVDRVVRAVAAAWRRTARCPSHSVPVLLILALGLGVTTALFSLLDSALWRRMPFPDAGRLVEIWQHVHQPSDFQERDMSRAQVAAWRRQTDLFTWVEGYEPAWLVLRSPSDTRTVSAAIVTPGLLARLGAHARVGRLFTSDDGGRGTTRRVIIGSRLWQREFAGNPAIVGRTISLDDQPYTVVGVAPGDFRFPDAQTEIWLPDDLTVPRAPPPRADSLAAFLANDSSNLLFATIARPRGSFADIDARVRARGVAVNASAGAASATGALIMPFDAQADAETRRVMWLLGGAVAFLLAIVCVNVAALTLARDLARAREIAVRAALGASRGALILEALCEHVSMGVLGAIAALPVAAAVISGALLVLPVSVADGTNNPVDLDTRALVFAGIAGLLAGAFFGLPAALGASGRPLAGWMGDVRRGTGTLRLRGLRATLVGAQVCLSLVLVVGAGLMTRTVSALYAADRGFDPRQLIAVQTTLPRGIERDAAQVDAFLARAAEALRQVPGVRRAAVGPIPPDSLTIAIGPLDILGADAPDRRPIPRARLYEVQADYFQTLGIPFVAGGTFRATDPAGAVVVSAAFAHAHWPGDLAVGGRFRIDEGSLRTVVGVVADVHHVPSGIGDLPQIYYQASQPFDRGLAIGIVRAARTGATRVIVARLGDPPAARDALVAALARIDPSLVIHVESAADQIAEETARARVMWVLLSGFAAFALAVCAGGLYALVSYRVAQRRREIGIRLALGARPTAIGRRVVSQALAVTTVGIGIGLAGSALVVGVLRSQLYGVGPFDPLTLGSGCTTLVALAAAAAWLPARRAMRLDPISLLRED